MFSNHLHHLHLGDQVRQVFLCCIRCVDKAEKGMEKRLRRKGGRQDKNLREGDEVNTQGSLSSGTCFSLYMTPPLAFFFFGGTTRHHTACGISSAEQVQRVNCLTARKSLPSPFHIQIYLPFPLMRAAGVAKKKKPGSGVTT